MSGVYTHTFPYQKKEDCMVCGGAKLTLNRSKCFGFFCFACFSVYFENSFAVVNGYDKFEL